jgi:hypothetical protein
MLHIRALIWAHKPAIINVFRDFPQFLQSNAGIVPQIMQRHFLPYTSQFIIILRCTI